MNSIFVQEAICKATASSLVPKGEALLQTLPADQQQKIKTNQFVKLTAYVAEGVLVRVEKA